MTDTPRARLQAPMLSHLRTRSTAWLAALACSTFLSAWPAHAQAPLVPIPQQEAPAPADALRGTMTPAITTQASDSRTVDYIIAVVDQEPITNSELQQRVNRAIQEGSSGTNPLPPRDELRKQVLDAMIDERAQLAHARNIGLRVSEAEIDQAIDNIAEQNQITQAELRRRLRADGIDYARFRQNLRERMILERLREREVTPRIRFSEAEIDAYIKEQLGNAPTERELDVAQILIALPEGAAPALVEEKRRQAEQLLAQVRAGGDFIKLAQDHSDDATTRSQGGDMGWRATSRVPDLFVNATTSLKPGDVVPTVLQSNAGFHIVKLLGRRDALAGYTVMQSKARHILLRPSGSLTAQAARAQLADIRRQIVDGQASFAQMARQYSQDGTSTRGGDLGWSTMGMFVPEFQKAMDALQPGQISQPVPTRFGVHLIQLMERREVPVDPRQLRENARNVLREQRFESTYQEWAREVRAQTYVEMREAPSQ